MDEQVPVLPVIQERGLNLEQIRVKLYQQLTSGFVSPLLQLLEQLGHFRRVEVVLCKSLVYGRLDGVGHSAKSISELVFNPGQVGIQKSGVGQNQ
jgi:hypothetical protein